MAVVSALMGVSRGTLTPARVKRTQILQLTCFPASNTSPLGQNVHLFTINNNNHISHSLFSFTFSFQLDGRLNLDVPLMFVAHLFSCSHSSPRLLLTATSALHKCGLTEQLHAGLQMSLQVNLLQSLQNQKHQEAVLQRCFMVECESANPTS